MPLDLQAVASAVKSLRQAIANPPAVSTPSGTTLLPVAVIRMAGEALCALLTPGRPGYTGRGYPPELESDTLPLAVRVKLKEVWSGLAGNPFWARYAIDQDKDEWLIGLDELGKEFEETSARQGWDFSVAGGFRYDGQFFPLPSVTLLRLLQAFAASPDQTLTLEQIDPEGLAGRPYGRVSELNTALRKLFKTKAALARSCGKGTSAYRLELPF